MSKLLVINAGSSSMKFEVYDKDSLKSIANGMAERIFVDGKFNINFNGTKNKYDYKMDSHKDAVLFLVEKIQSLKIIDDLKEIIGIGHRIVQGGEEFKESVLIDSLEVLNKIDNYSSLAPLHNPPEINVVKSFMDIIPGAKNVAVFDTSFHQTMPKINYMYATPQE
jgi:acetate kinase